MAAAESEHQQAHRGSRPLEDSGTMTWASLERARSSRKQRNSFVRKGRSQPTIKAKEHGPCFLTDDWSVGAVSFRCLNAVRIPPSGPSPGQRSSSTGQAAPAYLPLGATILTSWQTVANKPPVRSSMLFPASFTSALSVPKRVLPPPA